MAFPWKTVIATGMCSALTASVITYSVIMLRQRRKLKTNEKSTTKKVTSEVIFFPDPKSTPKGTKEENGLRHLKILNSSDPLKVCKVHFADLSEEMS